MRGRLTSVPSQGCSESGPVEIRRANARGGTRPTALIVASRRDSSINWIGKAGKVRDSLADTPTLRIAPDGRAADRKVLQIKALKS
jgi:hypothetical protein